SQSVNTTDAFAELHDVSRSWYYRYVEICTQVKNTNFTFLYNVNNGCTDDVVQRSSCLTREELLCQQLHSEEKQYDFFVSRVNQEVLFPLQQERIASPISRAQNPIPYNSSFMMHNPHHLHVTILKRALSPDIITRNHANESPLTKFGFITSSRRHSI
ncbi:32797_t:CDS:2, partial [Racocetra persica]